MPRKDPLRRRSLDELDQVLDEIAQRNPDKVRELEGFIEKQLKFWINKPRAGDEK